MKKNLRMTNNNIRLKGGKKRRIFKEQLIRLRFPNYLGLKQEQFHKKIDAFFNWKLVKQDC